MKLMIFYESIFLFWTFFNITFMSTRIVEKSSEVVHAILMDKIQRSQLSYWGVFLTLTDRQKYKICEDILKPDSWPITDIDGRDSVSFPLNAGTLKVAGQRMELGSVITFTCRGIDRIKNIIENTVSYGYFRNTFFVSAKPRRNVLVHSYVIGTAAYIIPPIPDLEQSYYDDRLQIENLRLESPDYVKLVETRSDIPSLLGLQKLNLCTEVFESPYYEWRRVMFKENGSLVRVVHKSVPLFFKKSKLRFKKFYVDAMICQMYVLDNKKQTFGLIQSYNHDNSLYVVAGTINEMYLDVYVKNIVGLAL